MSSSSTPPNRSGFFANFARAITPPVVLEDEDPDQPLVAPRTVTIASIIALLAAALYIFIGVQTFLATSSDQARVDYVADYDRFVAECTTKVGGVGAAAKEPADATDEIKRWVQPCASLTQSVDEMFDRAVTQARIGASVLLVIGLVTAAAGWFLRTGAMWARRTLVGIVVVNMLITMFMPAMGNLLTMVAALLLVAAVLLTYLGKGGVFFARAALRRKAA